MPEHSPEFSLPPLVDTGDEAELPSSLDSEGEAYDGAGGVEEAIGSSVGAAVT